MKTVDSAVKIHEKLNMKKLNGRFRGLDDYHVLHSPLYTSFFLPMIHRPGGQAALSPVPKKYLFQPSSQAHSSETFVSAEI